MRCGEPRKASRRLGSLHAFAASGGTGFIRGRVSGPAFAPPHCRLHAIETAGDERHILHIIAAAFRPSVQCRSERRRKLRGSLDHRRLPEQHETDARPWHARLFMLVGRRRARVLRHDRMRVARCVATPGRIRPLRHCVAIDGMKRFDRDSLSIGRGDPIRRRASRRLREAVGSGGARGRGRRL